MIQLCTIRCASSFCPFQEALHRTSCDVPWRIDVAAVDSNEAKAGAALQIRVLAAPAYLFQKCVLRLMRQTTKIPAVLSRSLTILAR
jgi:hypothetical protein